MVIIEHTTFARISDHLYFRNPLRAESFFHGSGCGVSESALRAMRVSELKWPSRTFRAVLLDGTPNETMVWRLRVKQRPANVTILLILCRSRAKDKDIFGPVWGPGLSWHVDARHLAKSTVRHQDVLEWNHPIASPGEAETA